MSRTFKNQSKIDKIKRVKQIQNKRNPSKRFDYYNLSDDEEFN